MFITSNRLTKVPISENIQIAKNICDFKLKRNIESSVIKELNRTIRIFIIFIFLT